jgi:hypothetical protein
LPDSRAAVRHSPRREKTFVSGFFADAAGVVEDEVGLRGRVHGAVAAGHQHARYFFGIVVVHLAAEGFDEEGFAGGRWPLRAGIFHAGLGVIVARVHLTLRGGLRAGKRVHGDVEGLAHGYRAF